MAMKVRGKVQKQALPLKLTFVRPNKVDFDAGQVADHQRRHDADDRRRTLEAVHGRRRPRRRLGSTRSAKDRSEPCSSAAPPVCRCSFCSICLTAADPAAAVAQIGGVCSCAGSRCQSC